MEPFDTRLDLSPLDWIALHKRYCSTPEPVKQAATEEDQGIRPGARFGKWKVVKYAGLKRSGKLKRKYYLCQCECGKRDQVQISNLLSGRSTRCSRCGREAAAKAGKENAKRLF